MPPPTFKPVPLFGGALTANMPADFADVSDIRQIPDNQEVYLAINGFTSVTVDLCERVTSPPPPSSRSAAAASSSSPSAVAAPVASSSSSSSPSSSLFANHTTTTTTTTPTTTTTTTTPTTTTTTTTPTTRADANADTAAAADNPNHYALSYHFFDIVAAEDTKRIYTTAHNIRLPHFPPSTPVSSLLAMTTPPPPSEGGRERGRNEAKWVAVIMTLVRLVQAETDMLVVVNVPFVPGEEGQGEGEGGEEVVDFERGVYGRVVEEGRAIMEGVLGSLRVVDWGLFGDDGGNGEGGKG